MRLECRECGTRFAGEPAPQWVCEQCGCANWDGLEGGMGRVLAVDFDGVIHRYSRGWLDGRIYDPPMEGAIAGMKKLQHDGWHLIIFTVRENLLAVRDWMIDWWPTEACMREQEEAFAIVRGTGERSQVFMEDRWREIRICNAHPIPQATNRKPGAHAYIDDRAFKFESWGGVIREFGKS